jgi:hypothetical protein
MHLDIAAGLMTKSIEATVASMRSWQIVMSNITGYHRL